MSHASGWKRERMTLLLTRTFSRSLSVSVVAQVKQELEAWKFVWAEPSLIPMNVLISVAQEGGREAHRCPGRSDEVKKYTQTMVQE